MNNPNDEMNRNFSAIMDKMNARIQFLVRLLNDEQYEEYEKWIDSGEGRRVIE